MWIESKSFKVIGNGRQLFSYGHENLLYQRIQTKFNYRFLFYIRFQTQTRFISKKREALTKKPPSNTVSYNIYWTKQQQTIIGPPVLCYCIFAKPISSHGLSFFFYTFTNNLHINSVHAASLSRNVFISFSLFIADYIFCIFFSSQPHVFEMNIDVGTSLSLFSLVFFYTKDSFWYDSRHTWTTFSLLAVIRLAYFR